VKTATLGGGRCCLCLTLLSMASSRCRIQEAASRPVHAPGSSSRYARPSREAPSWVCIVCKKLCRHMGAKPGQHLIYISGEFSRLAWLGLSPAISTRRLSYVSDLICHCMALLLVKLRFAGSSRLNSPPMLRRSWPGLWGRPGNSRGR
jgi:hypothetical protein